jgi:hypothetical protein
MHRVDTTYEVYTKELTGYEKEYEGISKDFQDVVAWVAATGSEGHDVVLRSGHGDFEVKWDLVRKVQFYDPNIIEALDIAEYYKDTLFGLEEQIECSPLKEHLAKYVTARAAYDEAKRRTVA